MSSSPRQRPALTVLDEDRPRREAGTEDAPSPEGVVVPLRPAKRESASAAAPIVRIPRKPAPAISPEAESAAERTTAPPLSLAGRSKSPAPSRPGTAPASAAPPSAAAPPAIPSRPIRSPRPAPGLRPPRYYTLWLAFHLLPWALMLLVVMDWLPESLRFARWSARTRTGITLAFIGYVLVDTAVMLWHVLFRSARRRGGRL